MATKGIRLSKDEQKMLEEKYFEIANARLEKGLKSIEESEIVHQILAITLPKVTIGRDGEIIISKDR